MEGKLPAINPFPIYTNAYAGTITETIFESEHDSILKSIWNIDLSSRLEQRNHWNIPEKTYRHPKIFYKKQFYVKTFIGLRFRIGRSKK